MNDATTSLLAEHFSYTPLSLIDDIINSINNLIYQAISSLENGLLSTPPERLGFAHTATESIPDTDADGNVEYPEARLEIENGLHQLETLLEATVDKAFDKFEIYVLRNILTVPEDLAPWVRLSHYENLSFGKQSPDAPTPESINLQRQKLHETRKLQRSLKQESARNEAVIAQLKSILSQGGSSSSKEGDEKPQLEHNQNLPNLSFLSSAPAAKQINVGDGTVASHTPLTTNTTFILSQLPALRAMLVQLRPKLASLPATADGMEHDSKREERRRYIESRTRIHLERTGELSTRNTNGFVKGRKIDSQEAHALEGVMGMLTDG
ncbi:hypothetical protein FQN54_001291 [Arachnomyces sp. PD_36]|nr:hypothetical protein FQN54_001291 [Arachnomyces sp. PD_36]